MANTRNASCSCGQLSLKANSQPVRVSICHCFACQKRTGSPFGAQARYLRSSISFKGESSIYTRLADSGNKVFSHFCSECGTTLYYYLAVDPDVIAVPIGAFSDPLFNPPEFSVYEKRRHPWVSIPLNTKCSNTK